MESRSYALLAGTFTLLLLAGVIVIAVLLNRTNITLTDYEIVSTAAVSGLSQQSSVRYQGVPVGKVQTLELDPNAPGLVHIRIGVASDTPITEATWAELTIQGITGLSNIDLYDDGSSKARLTAQGNALPAIPLRPGLFDRLSQGGGNIVNDAEKISSHLAALLSDQNVQLLQATMQNAAAMSASLKEISEQLRPQVSKVGPLIENLNDTSLQMKVAAQRLSTLAEQTRLAVAHLDAPDGPLAMATHSLREIAYAASRLSNDTLPAISGMTDQMSTAAHSISSTARNVGDSPQSIIFGAPPPRPGPGEAGFQGFGSTQ